MSFKLRAAWRGLTVASLTPAAVVADVCAFQEIKKPRAILRSSLTMEGEPLVSSPRKAYHAIGGFASCVISGAPLLTPFSICIQRLQARKTTPVGWSVSRADRLQSSRRHQDI